MCEVLACKCETQMPGCRWILPLRLLLLRFWFGIWELWALYKLAFGDVLPILDLYFWLFPPAIHYRSFPFNIIHPKYYLLFTDVLGPWCPYFPGVEHMS